MTVIRNNLFPLLILLSGSSLLFSLLQGMQTAFVAEIFLQIRLPHALTAFTAGGLLALSGALMQALLRNPLADPYILGVSSGSALLTLLGFIIGLSGASLIFSGWIGAFATTVSLFILAKNKSETSLLLFGVALTSSFMAFISFILFLSSDHAYRSMLFWLSGDFSFARIPYFAIIVLMTALLYSIQLADELNLLACGIEKSESLGLNTKTLRWKLFFLSSFLTATAVSLVGCIGFIGLIVPHFFRLLFGSNHKILLPGCILLGGSLLTIVEMFSRIIFYPLIVPVGILLALIGAPFFIFLLQRKS